jgi:hypothetical protein
MALIFPPSSPLTYSVTAASFLVKPEETSPPAPLLQSLCGLLSLAAGVGRVGVGPRLSGEF